MRRNTHHISIALILSKTAQPEQMIHPICLIQKHLPLTELSLILLQIYGHQLGLAPDFVYVYNQIGWMALILRMSLTT